MQVRIDFHKIRDRDGFHSAFSAEMGFPDFYGRNMDAWIDCMSYIDEPDAGMSSVTVNPGESLKIFAEGVESALSKCPDVFIDFVECTAFVNRRFIESGTTTRLEIIAT